MDCSSKIWNPWIGTNCAVMKTLKQQQLRPLKLISAFQLKTYVWTYFKTAVSLSLIHWRYHSLTLSTQDIPFTEQTNPWTSHHQNTVWCVILSATRRTKSGMTCTQYKTFTFILGPRKVPRLSNKWELGVHTPHFFHRIPTWYTFRDLCPPMKMGC